MTTPSRPKNANSIVMRQAPNSASAALPSSRPPAEAGTELDNANYYYDKLSNSNISFLCLYTYL